MRSIRNDKCPSNLRCTREHYLALDGCSFNKGDKEGKKKQFLEKVLDETLTSVNM